VNVIQEALLAGRPTYGIWAAGPSAVAAETLGRSGLDWILLDMQHGAVTAADLLPLIQAIELGGSKPLVRVARNDSALIMRALDLGAIGVVVPMVNTAEDARAAADSTRYPPAGTRSFGPTRRFYGLDAASASTTCLVMIETAEALANLEEIAATPGVDGLFVGPVDLGLALGAGLQLGANPIVDEAIARVIAVANTHGLIAGAAGLNPQHAEDLLAAGARLVTVGSDVGHLTAALAADRERTRRWTDRFSTAAVTDSASSPAPGSRENR
jgi:4-hydroxy-2-oxoheptanedioate aldolase